MKMIARYVPIAVGLIVLVCHWQTNAQELQPVSDPPPYGTFYLLSAQTDEMSSPPYPMDPYGGTLAIYELEKGVYLVADSPEDRLKLMIENAAMSAMHEAEGGGGYSPLDFGPDDLWIEILGTDSTNQLAFLTLHGTTNGSHYQLEQAPRLEDAPLDWQVGEIIAGAAGTNQTDFSPAPTGTNETLFYRAHQAGPIIKVLVQYGIFAGQNAIEPGTPGIFYLVNEGASLSNNLTVYYNLSGSAENGVDYTNLSGTATISPFPSFTFTRIDVNPIADGITEGTETITLTLVRTNEYLINPTNSSATITIDDGSPNLDYYLATNAVGQASGYSPASDMVQLANWSYAQYSGTNLALLTNAVWSTNFWLQGAQGLSATAIGYSNGVGGQILLTMVSPRHYLFAYHVGTPPGMIAFLDTNNVIYWRTFLQQVRVGNSDTSVGILDADLPSSVGFLPVVPTNLSSYLPTNSYVQGIGMNQLMKLFSQPMAGYSFFNSLISWNSSAAVPSGLGTNWNVGIVPGDSSNPERFLISNQLVLVTHNAGPGSGPNYALQFDAINQQMHYLSTNNNAGTDYQLTPFSLTNWPTIH